MSSKIKYWGYMKVIGHRGCRGLLPENTIEAFKKALELGVDALEFDVVVSGDHKIIVSHEPFMSRTICLKPDGTEIVEDEDMVFNLYKMTHHEIKKFDCGRKRHPRFSKQRRRRAYKPTLKETLEICEEHVKGYRLKPIKYIIEIKSRPEWYDKFCPKPAAYVSLILKTLKALIDLDRVMLKSFDVNILNEIRRQEPEQSMSLLVRPEEDIDKKLGKLIFTPEILGPHFDHIHDEEVIRYYLSKGFKIYTWTVNEVKDMKRLISLGVDAIITDYPDRLKSLFVK